MFNRLKSCIKYFKIRRKFNKISAPLSDQRFVCKWEDRWLCLNDATGTTGFDSHYLYHTAWAARILARIQPVKHIDLSSCLRFVSLVSAFIPVDFYDLRPAKLSLVNLNSFSAHIAKLPFESESIHSLSCMHVVEHIGLERYGDQFDPKGDLKAMLELKRVLATKGSLLFVVPIGGTARIQYNAHRIYTYRQIIEEFSALQLLEFSLVTDDGNFVENASMELAAQQTYGCGCFHFIK